MTEFNCFLDITLRIWKAIELSSNATGVSEEQQVGYG